MTFRTLPLEGTWTLSSPDAGISAIPAPVPGSVHDALLGAGRLADAHFGYGEADQLWVGSKVWHYARSFRVDDEFLGHDRVELVCDGLDTLCSVLINGREVGRADNMFRTWRFEVKAFLVPGENQIELRFDAVSAAMEAGSADRLLPAWNELGHTNGRWGPTGRGYIRKQACQFGWDWGPQCPSAGPWLALRLEARDGARIEDWHHSQTHHADGRVTVVVSLRPDRGDDLVVAARVSLGGETVAETCEPFWGGWEWSVTLDEPSLWWPNGMGEQVLYTLEVELMTADREPLDSFSRPIGLRRIELVREPDAWGRSFYFRVNGRQFFAKGANWIPLDAHASGQDLERRYRRDLESARDANMNMLRVWGGGYFAHEVFYDLCDRFGLLVWQDMMFGCGTYPVWDAGFRESVWRETVDAATRLRHHACLACWCGNNELEQGFTAPRWVAPGPGEVGKMSWSSYLDLFDRVLPSALALADPATPYLRGSPHCAVEDGRDSMTDRSGDFHYWEVWFSAAPFEYFRRHRHRFLSEFGFQSLPDAAVLAAHAPAGEELSCESAWLAFRQRSQPGNARVLQKTADFFGPDVPNDFVRLCMLTQLTQGLGLKVGIEFWRTLFPRCGGATYWQLNDRWAAPTWSTLDHLGHWKASHYLARAFFAPLLVVGIENVEELCVDCFVVNDHPEPQPGVFTLTVMNRDGSVVGSQRVDLVARGASEPTHVGRFPLRDLWPEVSENVLVWLDFASEGAGGVASSNLVLFTRPWRLELPTATIGTTIERDGDGLVARLRNGPTPALWVHAEADGHVLQPDENFFHLRPGEEKVVRIPIGEEAEELLSSVRFVSAV